MSGSDVVIAPNILEQMANDPEKAAYEPGGVVVHEDGSATYISGCSDSPERVREVNEINKAKREKEAAQRKESIERSQEAAEERKQQMEIAYKKQSIAETLANHTMDTSRYTYTVAPVKSPGRNQVVCTTWGRMKTETRKLSSIPSKRQKKPKANSPRAQGWKGRLITTG